MFITDNSKHFRRVEKRGASSSAWGKALEGRGEIPSSLILHKRNTISQIFFSLSNQGFHTHSVYGFFVN